MKTAVVAALVALALLGCAGPADAEGPSHRSGGYTSTGTVTGKDFIPEHQQWVMVGRQPYFVTLGDCWRLDLRWGPFRGWACVDPDDWARIPVGGYWGGGR